MSQTFMKITSNSEQAENTKSTERQKKSFPKEQVENTDLYKPVLNKIMTTQEQCVKHMLQLLRGFKGTCFCDHKKVGQQILSKNTRITHLLHSTRKSTKIREKF